MSGSLNVEDLCDDSSTAEQLMFAWSAFRNNAEGVIILNEAGQVVMVNLAYTAITGYDAKDVIGVVGFFDPCDKGRYFFDLVLELTSDHKTCQLDDTMTRKDGTSMPFLANVSRIPSTPIQAAHYVVTFQDISMRKGVEEQLKRLSHHDALTALPNRILLKDRAEAAIQRARRYQHCLALIFLDLDRFKTVNDSLGHIAGDLLIVQAAKRLQSSVRGTDTVARVGGDEFAIILDELKCPEDAGVTATKILNAFSQPFDLSGRQLHVSVSIGIACIPNDGEDFETLMHNADIAMYGAKEKGRACYQYYNGDLNVNALRVLNLHNAMHQALNRQEFRLHYQPLVELATGRITAVEALIRWHTPELGVVPPCEFIPIAEETGLILAIGDWLLEEALRQAARFHAKGHGRLRMSVNLSPRQFHQPNLVANIAEKLARTGVAAEHLELEVTETMVMDPVRDAQIALDALGKLGVQIALDDFGTGYSSLKYLKTFPISYLKIDKSFVEGIARDPTDSAIVQAISAMAHEFNISLVAEGVETLEQLEHLHALGCHEVQGYYLSMPLEADDLLWLLDNHSTLPAFNSPPWYL